MTSSSISQDSQLTAKDASEVMQPLLKDAMSGLNINLDYELARYRNSKRDPQTRAPFSPFQSPRSRSLNLMSIPGSASYPESRASQAKVPSMPPNPRLSQTTVSGDAVTHPAVESDAYSSEVSAPKGALVRQPSPSEEAPLASSEALFASFDAHSKGLESHLETGSKHWLQWLDTPVGLGALLLLLVSSAGLGFIFVNPYVARNLVSNTPLARLWSSPEDEVEASEDLASNETLENEASADDFPLGGLSPDLSEREFSDLDLNSLSNLPSNASSVGRSSLPEIANAEKTERSANDSTPPRVPSPETNSPATGIPANTPQQVNEIPRTTMPAPQPAAVIPPVQNPSPAPVSAPQSEPVEAVTVQPSEETTQLSLSGSTEGVNAQPNPPVSAEDADIQGAVSSEPASSYYVVSDYTGDPSLEDAREVVDDAYVRNFESGARIQLGAFNSEEGAAALAEELQGQGIEAQIYEPQE